MSSKNLGLVVVAHQPYIRQITADGENPSPENDIFFSALSQTYIPLVRLLHEIEEQNIDARFSIVLSPSVCAMLDDSLLQSQYVQWLDRRIELGKKEIVRLENDNDQKQNAEEILKKAIDDRNFFVDVCNCSLIKEFASFYSKGIVEIIATAGSYCFFPHYADMTEILNAQVETGIMSHKKYFGTFPEGFFLPYMGYAPGVEGVLRSYGITYTIVDSQSILFSEKVPETGIFSPVRCWNSLVLFGRDSQICNDIENPETGYVSSAVYKNQRRDIGFELSSKDLDCFLGENCPRANTLYRYWSKADENSSYDSKIAFQQAKADALKFLECENSRLEKAYEVCNGSVNLICTFDAVLLGQSWAEGMEFFRQIILSNKNSSFVLPSSLIKNQFTLPRIDPYLSAASGTGYGEDLLDSSNSWMIFYTRKMCERMIDLAERFPDDTGLKERLLNLGAKELILAQSGELAKMMHEGTMEDFSKKYFVSCVQAFTTVFDSLGSNIVSTEWLTSLEKKQPLFPWMNYKIFAKKH